MGRELCDPGNSPGAAAENREVRYGEPKEGEPAEPGIGRYA